MHGISNIKKGAVVPVNVITAYGDVDVFSTLALDSGEVNFKPRRYTPKETAPGTQSTAGPVGPSVNLGRFTENKITSSLPGNEPRFPARPTHTAVTIATTPAG
jgi:hypothetical protein